MMGSSGERAHVLVVDDDVAVGTVMGAQLRQAGYAVTVVPSAERALAALDDAPYGVVLTDIRMPKMDGRALMAEVHARCPELPVVLVTAHATVSLAVESMKAGAADFVQKPFDREELLFVVAKALEGGRRAIDSVPEVSEDKGLFGASPVMAEVRDLVARAARSMATVLVSGESGTGKELIARAIHDESPRRDKPFIKLSCAAFPDTLLESELFGYEKGAFTGASQRKPGRIELAHEGTLFLDEIGDITPATQVKLLRVLQEREIERLGGSKPVKVDVRFVAATHRDLPAMVASGSFREDLYYRLAVVPLEVPPLRARQGDVEVLAERFARSHLGRTGEPATFEPPALVRLAAEKWPGNVRQLQNFVERVVVLSDAARITLDDVERELRRGAPQAAHEPNKPTLEAAVQQAGRDAVKEALARANGNKTLAARILGVSRRALYYKLEELGLS
jgi:DNA-binding NtrC family response regulator